MISSTFQNNTFIEGMDSDTDVTLLSDKRYRYAENVRVVTNDQNSSGVLQGIEGVKKYNYNIPTTETIIGTTTVDKYAIVITKDSSGCNRVYRITDFNTPTPTSTVVLKGFLGLCQDLNKTPNLSLVANYESDDVIKIYFTDGNSSVKTLNISPSYDKYVAGSSLVDSSGNILNPLALDITPGCTLPPFRLIDLGAGSLPSGVVQYCYQLFNLRGVETTTSPLSQLVHLTSSTTNQNSQDYLGSYPEETSGKACTLQADLVTKDFERCRIIRILYTSNNQPPIISVIDEIELISSYSTITYTDSGNSHMADISVDEFNSLTGYQFIGVSLAKMQNRLFVADVTEDTWNPGYFDARAYRCNASGQTVLQSSSDANNLSFTLDTYSLANIPSDHDCINPYNLKEYCECSAGELYIYGTQKNGSSRLLGGHGLNIDYHFITVPLRLSNKQTNSSNNILVDNDCSMNVSAVSMSNIKVTHVGNSSIYDYITLSDGTVSIRQPNYADPSIASQCKGYQRDEIYRFGIIFYNKKSLPSPVYWIGDIKMPHADQVPPFYYSEGVLYGYALGINFTVRNVPDGTVSYEIVRCDRTENDRSVIMQTVASNVYEYKIQENSDFANKGSVLNNSVEMRPTPLFHYLTNRFGYIGAYSFFQSVFSIEDVVSSRVQGYLRLVSPEICLQQEEIENIFKNSTYLDLVGVMLSPTAERQCENGMGQKYITSTASMLLDPNNGTVERKYLAYCGQSKTKSYYIYNSQILLGVETNVAYGAEIAKYYVSGYQKGSGTVSIEDCKYPPDIPYNMLSDVNPYRINIGDRTYTNCAMTEFEESNGSCMFGAAGPCVVVKASQITNVLSGFSTASLGYTPEYSLNQIPIFNVKRKVVSAYGGNTYVSRQNSTYISTNSYVRITSTSSSYTTNTFGGDTFVGVLDYPNMFIFQANNISDYWDRKRYIGSYIPFESSINMNLFNGDMPHMTYTSNNYIDSHMQLQPQQTQVFHVQNKPFYVYNNVYSSQQGSRIFVPKSIYDIDNLHINNRILVSQAKTNNEILDNWAQFKVADYLDVDNQYGGITNLKVFKDRLFYFQNEAVGIASVNERSLITDGNNNQLVLGTGGILSRFDYITTVNGSSIKNDRSIVDSENVLYWYDFDKNEICAYNGGVSSLSKERNMQSYLNEMYDQKRNVNLAFYDKKYNEVWFKFYDKSLIFNEQLGRFTSFYTFNPDWNLSFSDKNVVIKDNIFYVINSLDTDGLGNVDKTSKIKFVVNKDIMYTKTFDNISIFGQMNNANGANVTNGLVEQILFNTKHQTATANNPTFDYREDTYRLPIPRQDTNNEDTSLSYPARIKGKYLTCEYHFNSGDENTFRIPLITTTYRYSLI